MHVFFKPHEYHNKKHGIKYLRFSVSVCIDKNDLVLTAYIQLYYYSKLFLIPKQTVINGYRACNLIKIPYVRNVYLKDIQVISKNFVHIFHR